MHCKGQRLLYNSLAKYGYENHKIELIEIISNDCEDKVFIDREKFHINAIRESGVKMLNLIYSDNANTYHSQETRDKISNSLRGKRIPKSVIHKRTISRIGFKMPESAKLKLSQIHIGNKKALGKIASQERRNRISAALKGRTKPNITGENNPSKRLEVRKKISESKILYWKNKRDNANRHN